MNVIVTIEGREAVPVRAIPLLTTWQVLTPDEIANLAATRAKSNGQTVLSTHRLEGGRVLPVSWVWWEEYVVMPLLAIEKKIRAQFADDDIGLQEWKDQSLRALPAGVFVWRDELEEIHLRKFGQEGETVSWETEEGEMDPGEVADRFQTLDFEPVVQAEWEVLVMDGFVSAVPPAVLCSSESLSRGGALVGEKILSSTQIPGAQDPGTSKGLAKQRDPLQDFRDMEGLSFGEVSISFVGDRFDEGDRVGANSQMDICAREKTRRVPLAMLDLIDSRSGELNEQGKVLLRCALGTKQENSESNRQKISRTRKLLKEKLGIDADPFQRYHEKTGWVPVFKVAERRGLADERARREAERLTVSFDRLQEVGREPGAQVDDDEAGRWLRENDPEYGA